MHLDICLILYITELQKITTNSIICLLNTN